MKKILTIILFTVIFFLGAFLRFHDLGKVPNSLDWDEVSWGYNAYSILNTGKDEYGAFLPLSFKAFGDYKQPVYVYADVIPIKLFGLNAFSIRLPNALLGTLSIIFVFLLVNELFKKRSYAKTAAFLSMFFFAISPWHIQFSRVAFESVVGLFFVLVGVWLFIRGYNLHRKWYFFAATIFLALSAYSYHAEKLFTPLFVVGLVIFAKDYFLSHKKLFVIFGLCFVLLNSLWLLDSRTTARGKSVLFTSEQTQLLKIPLIESGQDIANNQNVFAILHNRRIIYAETFLENYLKHFDPNWLFIQGDIQRHHAPDFGLMYVISLPFILMGAYFLFKNERMIAFLLGYWFFLAPISGSLVTGSPNAERALIMLPIWQILEALGFIQLVRAINKKILKKLLLVFISLIYLFLFMLYVNLYFLHTNSEFGQYWQYGYEQAVNTADRYTNGSNKILFSKEYEQGYIFYLFYSKYDPAKYIQSGGSNRITQQCFNVGNVYFENCLSLLSKGDVYISLTETNIKNMKKVNEILDKNGKTVGYVYKHI
jgi:4-amino-4-deoxy-L-arabinose transferase-like glycosyltransferase